MALWQVSFAVIPNRHLGTSSQLEEKQLLAMLSGRERIFTGFALPPDYRRDLELLLPVGTSWSPDLELWGEPKTDDFSIWRTASKIHSIELRLDVRKLDDELLEGILDLVAGWECSLVELDHRTVCRFSAAQLRQLLTGHVSNRAMRDPDVWLPFLAERAAGNGQS